MGKKEKKAKNYYIDNKEFQEIIMHLKICKKHKARVELMIEDLQESFERKKSKDPTYEDKKLKDLQSEYQVACSGYNFYHDKLARELWLLAQNIANWNKFSLIDHDDAIQEGVWIGLDKVDRFDPDVGKAFSYMTACILNHFKQIHRTAKNQNEIKKRYHNHLLDTSSNPSKRWLNRLDDKSFQSAID